MRGKDGAISGRIWVFRDATKERENDRLKTEFVGRVSHELRTPLTSIKGFIELILDGDVGEVSPEVREFLTIAYDSSELLISIVNDILDITRIDAQSVHLDAQPVDLGMILHATSKSLQPMIDARRQHLAVDLPTDLPLVYADQERLKQIMINLINNANKFTPDGGSIAVRAWLAPTTPDMSGYAPMLVVSVTDTGIGIPTAHQAQIFERFYRVDAIDTQKVKGNGLGLSIVRSLVELHGGTIWVESTEGSGATFCFTLPTMLAPHTGITRTLEPFTA